MAAPQDAHQLEHIVLIGSEDGSTAQFVCYSLTSVAIQHFHRDQNHEDAPVPPVISHPRCHSREIAFISGIDRRAGAMKINCAIVASFVGSSHGVSEPLPNGRLDRPEEWIDWANR